MVDGGTPAAATGETLLDAVEACGPRRRPGTPLTSGAQTPDSSSPAVMAGPGPRSRPSPRRRRARERPRRDRRPAARRSSSSPYFRAPKLQARPVLRPVERHDEPRAAPRRRAAFVVRARQTGHRVFLHLSSHDLRIKQAKLPSVRRYSSRVRRLVRYFRRLGVREFGTWNEANHASQPTYRSPRAAAKYFRDHVPRGQGPLPLVHGRRARRARPARRHALHAPLLPRAVAALPAPRDASSASTTTATSTAGARTSRGRSSAPRAATTAARASGSPRPARSSSSAAASRATRRARRTGCGTCSASRAATGARACGALYVYNWSGAGCGARFDAGLTTPYGDAAPRRTGTCAGHCGSYLPVEPRAWRAT